MKTAKHAPLKWVSIPRRSQEKGPSSKQRKLDMFWKHASHMLKGIALFQKHGILHHDVKPQNIVFNMKNEHIRFIDFGFMEKINTIKQKCIKNKHYIAAYPFWSYPFEFPYLNKERYYKHL
jgi:serine/threonine protein kinase